MRKYLLLMFSVGGVMLLGLVFVGQTEVAPMPVPRISEMGPLLRSVPPHNPNELLTNVRTPSGETYRFKPLVRQLIVNGDCRQPWQFTFAAAMITGPVPHSALVAPVETQTLWSLAEYRRASAAGLLLEYMKQSLQQRIGGFSDYADGNAIYQRFLGTLCSAACPQARVTYKTVSDSTFLSSEVTNLHPGFDTGDVYYASASGECF